MNKKKILVVDDEEAYTRLLQINLRSLYDIRVENNGSSICEVVRDFQPDLILLDMMMPGMDGCEVARKLKEDSGSRNIPIVFITAIVRKNESANNQTTVNGYPCLAKPVSLEELAACIKMNLRKP